MKFEGGILNNGEKLNGYLKEGINPIKRVIYDRKDINREDESNFLELSKNSEHLDFKQNQERFFSKKFNCYKKGTYLISGINENNIYIDNLLDCTSVSFLGVDKITNKNISFATHQNPEAIFENDVIRERFIKDLNSKIDELKSKCITSTIDVGILGGNDRMEEFVDILDGLDYREIIQNYNNIVHDKYDYYRNSIKLLNKIISDKLGFSPTVVLGLNHEFSEKENNSLDVYLDNENRILKTLRPHNDPIYNESFLAKDIDDQIEKIKKEEKKSNEQNK